MQDQQYPRLALKFMEYSTQATTIWFWVSLVILIHVNFISQIVSTIKAIAETTTPTVSPGVIAPYDDEDGNGWVDEQQRMMKET